MIAAFLVVLLGFLIRVNQMPSLMPFLQDQGWFYISARELALNGHIPLVGITSSHTWLHQGPIWTYILSALMKLFGFNPAVGGYFIVIAGSLTIFLLYFVLKEMFSHRVGLVGALLFATSPLVIFHSRMSYHTSLIPLLMVLLIYSVFKWIKGDKRFFPLIFLLTALLYNFELATSVTIPVFIAFLLFGFIKKKEYIRSVLNFKTILISALVFLIPMVPVLVYDLKNGFPQTIKFVVWVFYKLAVFLGYPPINPNAPGETWVTFFNHFSIIIKKIVFADSLLVSLVLLTFSFLFILFTVYKGYKAKKLKPEWVILFSYLSVSILGYIVTKTNSEAYLLIAFPLIFSAIALLFDYLMQKKAFILPILVVLIIMAFLNVRYTFNSSYLSYGNGYGVPYKEKLEVTKKIIKESDGRPYNIVGRGWGSQYESFTKTYEYLTWWQGNGPSKKSEKLKFYITELPDKIVLENK